MPKAGVFKTIDNVANLMKGIAALTGTQVMVGVPEDKAQRQSGDISNAALAYIHDNGAPEANIPARPFMEPGIKSVKDQIITELANAGKAVFKGGAKSVLGYYNRIGIIASRAIKLKIGEGIPPPLALSTIKGRINRVKSKSRRKKIAAELAAGTPASRIGGAEGLFTPLIVTAQLRNAITYVLRKVEKGTK